MAGISSILENIRREVALAASQARKRIGDLQVQVDALTHRLDKIDQPANTQTGAAARKAAASGDKRKSDTAKTSPRKIPVPKKPAEMGEGGTASI